MDGDGLRLADGDGRRLRPDALRRIAGPAGMVLLGLCAANCSGRTVTSGKHPSELKYGVASSPRVIPEGQPVPKGGGREMVGKPYVVAGRTYIPHPGRGYDRVGSASWYGSAFHGRLTANGEIFDRDSVAAAHPTLPLPSYVRVTNVENNRSMIVRVNDRGPYERNRIIDLSERAAHSLGFHRRGTSRVRVQYVGRASLAGSDDLKLLATLTTNGAPAHLGEPTRPIMIAQGGAEKPASEERALREAAPPETRRIAASPPISGFRPQLQTSDRTGPRLQFASHGGTASERQEPPRPVAVSPKTTTARTSSPASPALSRTARSGDADGRGDRMNALPPPRPDLRGAR